MTSAAEFLLDAAADPSSALYATNDRVPYVAGATGAPPPAPAPRAGSKFAPLLQRAWLNNARSPVATVAALGRFHRTRALGRKESERVSIAGR